MKRAAFITALLSTLYGCATARPPVVEAETVGTLSASYASIATGLKSDGEAR